MVNDASRKTKQDERKKARERFLQARRAEVDYVRQLRSVAKQVGNVIKAFSPKGIVSDMSTLNNVLQQYAKLIRPWATVVSERMISEVSRRDEKAWVELSRTVGKELGMQLKHAPVGKTMREFLNTQVELITSIPTEAAARVHKLTIEALENSTRAEEIKQQIMASTHVTESRAMLIARTEVARTASALTMSRAQHIGSDGYIWRTARDQEVRPSHKKMEGVMVRWNTPPTLDGMTGHAGMFPNCRCYPEPVIPDNF